MSLREELLAIDERQTKEIEVPKLGRKLHIRELSGTDRDYITNLYMQADGTNALPPRIHETIVVRGVVDDNGKRVFEDKDVELIAEKWGSSIKKISDEILEFSGMGTSTVEDEVKNSSGDPNDASGSGSPPSLAEEL